MVGGRKMTSGHHIYEAGYFARPCGESRGWFIRSPLSRKTDVSRNVYLVRHPTTRHARLALTNDLIGRHGALDTAPAAYRSAVRKPFAPSLVEPKGAALIEDGCLSGVPVALVSALDAGGEHAMASELAWPGPCRDPIPPIPTRLTATCSAAALSSS